MQILPKLTGQKINEYFDIVRPLIQFTFAMILQRSNNIFELMTVDSIDVLLKVGFLNPHNVFWQLVPEVLYNEGCPLQGDRTG